MARTIKENEYIRKRNEILTAAQRMVYSKGYERMTIQDILEELKISSGAFYHYFASKPAVLEALIEHMQLESEQPLLSIVHDPHLSAIEKLRHFFSTLEQLMITQKTVVVEMLRVWYTDENAIVRQKVDAAVIERRAPLLTGIVCQGIQEGTFSTPYPESAGEIILTLLQGMGNTHAKLLLSLDRAADDQQYIETILATYAAYISAIERVLGMPAESLYRLDAGVAKTWVTALRANPQD